MVPRKDQGGPSLRPSIGNWQQACQSHYWITGGKVVWAEKWTAEEIADGRRHEEERSLAYYKVLHQTRGGRIYRLWSSFQGVSAGKLAEPVTAGAGQDLPVLARQVDVLLANTT